MLEERAGAAQQRTAGLPEAEARRVQRSRARALAGARRAECRRDSDFLFTRLSPPLFISNFHFPVLSFIIFSFSFFPEFIEDVIYISYMYNLSFRL